MTVTGPSLTADISPREAEVLAALGEHLTNAEIAERLYISVRTVESHVSSLLRKLGVGDRRELAGLAALVTAAPPRAAERAAPVLPVPLTSFVGRAHERAELAGAIRGHRLVTATGPGGVGKTRLAVAVAAEVMPTLADAGWFVDLVPVTDPAMVAAAVAGPLGVAERQGGSVEDAVLDRLRSSEALLVLDNCEHVLDGVATFVERLLGVCPQMRVLATSRARLMPPFERVFPVPGLSVNGDAPPAGDTSAGARGADGDARAEADRPQGDAVALFVERATATGPFRPTDDDRRRIAAICRALEGMALAIELAAARLPTLGLDGIESGLADSLRLLAGGPRLDQRHRSLRSTIDWSYALLDAADQALLRRVSVFAAPFTADAATEVAGGDLVPPEAVADGLARLADHSLLIAIPGAETRYRVLETIRQHGDERLDAAGELVAVRTRHLRWCLATAAGLRERTELDSYVADLAPVVDDLRASLLWAAERPDLRAEAHRLALLLGELMFQRGLPAEAQRRYEEAARLAPDDAGAAAALADAAGAALSRQVGNEGLRLLQETADAALRAGDRAGAARFLAISAQIIQRCPGIIAELPPDGTTERLLVEARALATGDPRVEPAILAAEAYNGGERDPITPELAERAVELARRVDDTVVESGALDYLTAVYLAFGEVAAAVASIRQRTQLLDAVAARPEIAIELADGYAMASEVCLTAGDIPAARRYADRVAALPFLREQGHLAVARHLKVDAMAGDIDAVLRAADRFRRDWERAGRPVASNLGGSSYAVAMVHGLRRDARERDGWIAITTALGVVGERLAGCHSGYGPVFDAVVALHDGDTEAALARLAVDPDDLRSWYTGEWRPWYTALWAEAGVLAGRDDAARRVERARFITAPNPIARAMTDRAAALLAGDAAGLRRAAAALEPTGCRYQWARTLVLAGGDEREAGDAAMAALGAAPMAV